MQSVAVVDIAKRFTQNPLLSPGGIKAGNDGMEVERLSNPGVFRLNKKTWLLVRVEECPVQTEGYVSLPRYNDEGEIEILQFAKTDPQLDFSDPRLVHYKGTTYL